MTGSPRRDRHGRGARAPVLPSATRIGARQVALPAFRSRRDRFDDLVRAAFEELERRWPDALASAEFFVEEVPPPDAVSEARQLGARDGLVADQTPGGAVPLGRVRRATADAPARFVVYRHPVEVRTDDPHDLAHLVREIVVDLVAELLDLDPDEVDPG